MVETQTFERGKVRAHYHSYSQAELKRMTPEQLADALTAVERQMTLWNQDVKGKPAWFKMAARSSRNTIARERRHIERELKARAAELVEGGDA